MHAKATASYSRRNMWYTLPVIVMSTFAGAANFSQERVPEEYRGYFAMSVGMMNIIAGIVTTIQQFLKITQLNEAHRVSSIAWDKFYRNIKTELAKHPKERVPVIQFLKMFKDEYDRLMETSPTIPQPIIDQFNYTFGPNTDRGKMIKDIARPEICDVLKPTDDMRNPWYTEENMKQQAESQFRSKLARAAETKRMRAHQANTVADFKKMFFNLNNREPMDEEVVDNLADLIDSAAVMEILRKEIASVNAQRGYSDSSASVSSGITDDMNHVQLSSHSPRNGSTDDTIRVGNGKPLANRTNNV